MQFLEKFLCLSLLLFLGQGASAWADDHWCDYRVELRRLVGDISHRDNDDHYRSEIQKYQEALSLPNLKPCELSTIYVMLGHYHYQQDNIPEAIANNRKAIDAGGLQPDEAIGIEKNIAQLMIANGDYVEGARALEDWVEATGERNPKNIRYIMQALIQVENYSEALPYAEEWFDNAEPKERKHYDLMNFLYNDQGQQSKQLEIVLAMIEKWPEDQALWDNWISLLNNGGRERDAFDVHKMRYAAGHYSSEANIKKLVEYHHYYGQPYQAARIMEVELTRHRLQNTEENYLRLYGLYRESREPEKALGAIERAAGFFGSHKIWADYGSALCEAGQTDKADKAFETAIEIGGSSELLKWEIAFCHYNNARKIPLPSCARYYDVDTTASPRYLANENTIDALKNIQMPNRNYEQGQKLLTEVVQENEGIAYQCGNPVSFEDNECFKAIKNAYALEIIRGEFSLSEKDKRCLALKEEYDARYIDK